MEKLEHEQLDQDRADTKAIDKNNTFVINRLFPFFHINWTPCVFETRIEKVFEWYVLHWGIRIES